ncbi:MAG: sigma-70 family RNA polymerase sigma factor [Myxococcota bacterium]
MENKTDFTLATRAADRDPKAWRAIWRHLRAPLVRTLARFAPSRADDLFGDLCVALLEDGGRRLRAYDPARGSLRTYLGAIARNLALNQLRRPSHAPIEGDTPFVGDDPLAELIAREQAVLARALVATLGARDAELLRLHLVDGLRPRAVAAAMGISETTVYTKKHKLVRRLARIAMAA